MFLFLKNGHLLEMATLSGNKPHTYKVLIMGVGGYIY